MLLVFWFAGGFGWLDGWARSLAPSEVTAGLVFLAALFLGQSLIALPFSVYDTFVIENKFGFNRATPATFIMDRLKGLLLAALIGLPLAAAVLWIFGNVSHAWLWAWAVVTVFQLLLTWLAPSLIMPLFNKFTPMPEGELKQEIEALGTRCGFPLAGVFVMDGSKRSTKANAFFTGFGKQKKIALFDTLIEKSSTPELLGVLAHEIGHFRRGHIKQRLAAGILQTAAIFFLLGLATDPSGKFARLLFDAFGVAQISPHVGLVLFSILLEPVEQSARRGAQRLVAPPRIRGRRLRRPCHRRRRPAGRRLEKNDRRPPLASHPGGLARVARLFPPAPAATPAGAGKSRAF